MERTSASTLGARLINHPDRRSFSPPRLGSTCTAWRLYDQLDCPESPNHPRVSDGKRAFVGTYSAPPSIMTPHFTRRGFFNKCELARCAQPLLFSLTTKTFRDKYCHLYPPRSLRGMVEAGAP